MRELTWFERGDGATENQLKQVEGALGQSFPDDVRGFLSKYAGSSNPDESSFEVVDASGVRFGTGFGEVLRVTPDAGDIRGVLAAVRDLRDQLPPDVVPIIGTGGGDYVCVDFRNRQQSSLVYFAHERMLPESLIALAPDLTSFLETLRVPEDLD